MSVGRSLGDAHVGPGVSARPKITKIPLSKIPPGSHLVLVCDGVTDVASTKQIGVLVKQRAAEGKSSLIIAENLVDSAYEANSEDNLSALVVRIPEIKIFYK